MAARGAFTPVRNRGRGGPSQNGSSTSLQPTPVPLSWDLAQEAARDRQHLRETIYVYPSLSTGSATPAAMVTTPSALHYFEKHFICFFSNI
jgi:hypothetical protein